MHTKNARNIMCSSLNSYVFWWIRTERTGFYERRRERPTRDLIKHEWISKSRTSWKNVILVWTNLVYTYILGENVTLLICQCYHFLVFRRVLWMQMFYAWKDVFQMINKILQENSIQSIYFFKGLTPVYFFYHNFISQPIC